MLFATRALGWTTANPLIRMPAVGQCGGWQTPRVRRMAGRRLHQAHHRQHSPFKHNRPVRSGDGHGSSLRPIPPTTIRPARATRWPPPGVILVHHTEATSTIGVLDD